MPGEFEHLYDGMLSHAMTFVGLSLMTGHATWRSLVSRSAPLDATERGFFRAGSVLAVLGAIVNARQATLSMAEVLTPATLRFMLVETAFGQSLVLHAGFLAAAIATGLLLARLTGTAGRPVLWLPALGALLGQSLVGHASAEGLAWPLVAYGLHVTGGVIWLGGLFALLGRMSRGYAASLVPAIRGFGRVALTAMAILLPAGLALTGYFIPEPERAWSSYGGVLGLKLALVAGVLALACGHRRKCLPRLGENPEDLGAWRAFDARLSIEIFLAVLVVVVAGALSQIPPP